MRKPQHKPFRENMPGNYLPANRAGWLYTIAFVVTALAIVLIGHRISDWLENFWPAAVSWVLFVIVTIGFVLFARRHS
ncbi:hypothetical protein [Aurantiacibacter odishensis]|uniref:hypothetical protein n=1 Tax=Aurantiacibacter odishensis TaxID=1155476 RepID=UPI00196AB112|nr:hypothetical protein [Aurantiacibacter odishensis]